MVIYNDCVKMRLDNRPRNNMVLILSKMGIYMPAIAVTHGDWTFIISNMSTGSMLPVIISLRKTIMIETERKEIVNSKIVEYCLNT